MAHGVDSAAVIRVSLDEPLTDLVVPDGHRYALVVAVAGGAAIGELRLPVVGGAVAADSVREAVDVELAGRLSRRALERAFARATRGATPATPPDPSVAVVVLHSGDDAERRLSEVTTELVALTHATSVPDSGWLTGLGESFADPLVMAVAGYVPGRGLPFERTLYDGVVATRADLPPENLIVRRAAFDELGPYGDEFLTRILRAGYRVMYEPTRIVWLHDSSGRRATPAPAERGPDGSHDAESARITESAASPLTVTIASYNRRDRLEEALRGLARQTYPAERFELVLVLDGSTDGSVEMARSLELPYELRLLEQENRGLAASRNRGGREAKHPIVVWLDDDIVVEPGALAAHAGAHARAARDAVVLGHYPPARGAGDLLSTTVRNGWQDFFRRRSEPDHQWSYIDFVDGHISAKASLLLEAGGWDEDFASATVRRQDWEFAIRLIEKQVTFVDCPAATGLHYFDSTLPTVLRNRRVEGRSDVVLGQKHPQVRGHLFLARLATSAAAGGVTGRLVELTYRSPQTGSALMRGGRAAARPLEAFDRRREWWALFGRLLSLAYLSGVRDALPTLEQFREFCAPIRAGEAAVSVPVSLDRDGKLDLAPAVTPVRLHVTLGPTTIGDVDALEPETQWDWRALSDRVLDELGDAYRAAATTHDGT